MNTNIFLLSRVLKPGQIPAPPPLIMLENFQTTFDKTLINSPGQITKWWITSEVNIFTEAVQVLEK